MRAAAVAILIAVVTFVTPVTARAHEPHIEGVPAIDPTNPEIGQHDFEKGTKHGSPLDELPEHMTLLDLDIPNAVAVRPDWSPDGTRLIVLDGEIGNVWEYDLRSKGVRQLTGAPGLLPGGVLRAHYLANGDLVLCAPAERDPEDPAGDRFRGELWILTRPLGKRPPARLGEPCWEGVAVSKQPGSTRIAWNRSTIDFTKVPEVFVEAATGQSEIRTGRIVYDRRGNPSLVDKMLVVERDDVAPNASLEVQDFRRRDDGDADVDDELIFTAYAHRGGEVMGVDLETRRIVDYSRAPWYEEAEGVDPAGEYVLVERDTAIVVFPGPLDIWRLTLDGSGSFERMTFFNHYHGFKADQPVVSPDGRRFVFNCIDMNGEEETFCGLLLFDLEAWDDDPNRPAPAPDPVLLPPRP